MESRGSSNSVQLRNFCVADLDEFYEWLSDEQVTKFTTWEAIESKERAREILTKVVIPHPWFRAICVNGRAVGHIVLKQGEGIHSCRAEIGYVISRNYWNRGLATQAVQSALKNGLSELKGVERVEGLVLPENAASARVLEKAGFRNNGFFPKYVRVKGCVEDCFIFSYVVP
ncbi:hypothetical protein SUGI_0190780 [Cryptomeria japonica]|uniref:uncharacterized protein LOC131040171 n=1 Tax=Cryptomeria japonica TaxID=3369 RepID=UPI002408CBF5|nr:uncharacterized protein LOC131040171 [Cryptomeria japonica]GLJ12428.1 hypothetical protein SUGI_0190780 [Cryptomeria japonica]